MSKYLSRETRNKLKERFDISRAGYVYTSPTTGKEIVVRAEDLHDLHDFLVFTSTKEYHEWVKMKLMDLSNDRLR